MPEAQDFAEAYTLTHYKTPKVSFTLSKEATGVALFDGRSFTIITAHNPRSEAFSKEDNDQRHHALLAHVRAKNYNVDSSLGQSPDGSWQEEGLVLFDIDLKTSLHLGRHFEQHAILYGENNKVALAWCESEKLEWFYPKLLSES
jgi:hypothetical protein